MLYLPAKCVILNVYLCIIQVYCMLNTLFRLQIQQPKSLRKNHWNSIKATYGIIEIKAPYPPTWEFLGGGNSNIFYFHPWGNDPIWRAYFSDGLVQPPTRFCWSLLSKTFAPTPSSISLRSSEGGAVIGFLVAGFGNCHWPVLFHWSVLVSCFLDLRFG